MSRVCPCKTSQHDASRWFLECSGGMIDTQVIFWSLLKSTQFAYFIFKVINQIRSKKYEQICPQQALWDMLHLNKSLYAIVIMMLGLANSTNGTLFPGLSLWFSPHNDKFFSINARIQATAGASAENKHLTQIF